MSDVLAGIGLAMLLFAVGMWLMLPRGAAGGRLFGTILVVISFGLLAWHVPRVGSWANDRWLNDSVFFALAALTVLSAVGTVTFRNPIYSAIWFGLSLLGTAGLFLFQGAQFLGVATVVVYAGAILVTFLFVLMLAQPEGNAFYDRISWGASLAALTGAIVTGVLVLSVIGVLQTPEGDAAIMAPNSTNGLADGILASEHMANLGARLFSVQLVAIEVAGTLLLAALVGTVAIVSRIEKTQARGGASHG